MADPNDLASRLFGGPTSNSTPGAEASAPVSVSAPSGNSDLASRLFGGGNSPAQSETSDPTPTRTGIGGGDLASRLFTPSKQEPSREADPSNPNDPWYKKAWDWANTPLVDEQSIERWTGREGQTGGFEKGTYDVASGLTTPLSIALAVGTFGSGTLFESGGAAALRAAGMGEEAITSVVKGSQIVADTLKAGKSEQQAYRAITAAGLNPETVQAGLETLKDAGLTGEALATHGVVRTAGAQMLRSLNLPIAQAEKVATGVQGLIDAGFSVQNAYGAVMASPRVLDALKDGDYETAKRLAVNALGGAGFAYLGAKSAFKDAGQLMDETAVNAGLHVKPSEENLKLTNEFGVYNRDTVSAGRGEELWAQDLRKQFPGMKPDDLALVMKYIQSGMDEGVLAQRHNWLAEAAGSDKRVPLPASMIEGLNVTPADLPNAVNVQDFYHGTGAENIDSILEKGINPTKQAEGDAEGRASLTQNPRYAMQYPSKPGPRAIVVTSLDPGTLDTSVLKDTEEAYSNRTIPPEAIKQIREYDADGKLVRIIPGKSAKPLTSNGNHEIVQGANEFKQANGLPVRPRETVEVDPRASSIADAYDALRHNPNDPAVQKSYASLIKDIKAQWDHATKKQGMRFEPAAADDPYASSKEMMEDVKDNKRLKFFQGGKLPGDHPLAAVDPETGLSYNEMFRAIHDYYGHAAEGFQFGPKGEENAWNTHRQMFSPESIPALTTETKGQNSWVNSGKHLRNAEGKIPEKGEKGYISPDQRPFAQQKAALLPKEYWYRPGEYTPTNAGQMEEARIRELIAEHRVKPADADNLLSSYNYQRLTPKMKEMAKHISDHFSETLEKAQQHGALSDGIDHYVTHLWEQDRDNESANRLLHQARNGSFAVNTSMARHRMLASAFEGELLGKKLAVTDPVTLAANNGNTFARVTEARKLMDRMQDKGTRASDGRPMVALSGAGHVISGDDGNPAVLVNPQTVRNIRIADKVIKGLQTRGEFDKLVEEEKIAQIGKDKEGKPIYGWNAQDYQNVNHPAFRDWKYATQDTQGNPVLMKGDLRVHPEAFDYINKQLGQEKSPLQDSGIGRGLLAAAREGKGLLLSFSPFHIMQEGLRAVMTGVSPFGIERWDLRNDPVLAKGVEKGLTLGKEYKGVQAFEEGKMSGHSHLLSKIPGVGKLQDYLQEFLFDKYIPGLKARGYRNLVERYQAAYPDWTPSKVAEVAAADTNERFGGINYKRMGRSVATQDLFRLTALAPDWLESEMRFMARTFGDEGKIARTDTARMAVGMWGAMRVLNYLTSGQPHNEAPFGVAVKDKDGKEKVYSIRTLPTDMLHAVQQPGEFLAGRASPLVRTGIQTYTGRDEMGRKLASHDVFVNAIRNIAPIPIQTLAKTMTGETPDVSNIDATAKAAGLTVFPYRTEAQKLASKLASDHAESGAVDETQLRRHQALIRLSDQLRSGDIKPEDVFSLVEKGDLSIKEGKQAMKEAQETSNMEPDVARLWVRASRLPMSDMLSVWDSANNTEKASLASLLIRKRISYYKKAMKEMTPQQRMSDPTYRRLREMFPQESPW